MGDKGDDSVQAGFGNDNIHADDGVDAYSQDQMMNRRTMVMGTMNYTHRMKTTR